MGNSCCCHVSCCPSRVHESLAVEQSGEDSPASTNTQLTGRQAHNRPVSAGSRNSFRKEEAPRSLLRREPSTEHLDSHEEGGGVVNQVASAHAWQPYAPPHCPPATDSDSSSSGEYEMPEEQSNVAAGVFGNDDTLPAGDSAAVMVSHSFDHSPPRGDPSGQRPPSARWNEDDDDDEDDHESNSRTRAMLARLQQRKKAEAENGGRAYQGFPQQVATQPPRTVIVAGDDSDDDDVEGPAEDLPANAFGGF